MTANAQADRSVASTHHLINRAFGKTADNFYVQDTALCNEVVLMRAQKQTKSKPTNSQVGEFRHSERHLTSRTFEALIVAMARLRPDSLEYYFKQLLDEVDSLWKSNSVRNIVRISELDLKTGRDITYPSSSGKASQITKSCLQTMELNGITFQEVKDLAAIFRRAQVVSVRVGVESLKRYRSGETDPKTTSLGALLLIFRAYNLLPTCLADMRSNIELTYGLKEAELSGLTDLVTAALKRGNFEPNLPGYSQLITTYVWSSNPNIPILPGDLIDVARGERASVETLAALVVLLRESGVGEYTVTELQKIQDKGSANGADASVEVPH